MRVLGRWAAFGALLWAVLALAVVGALHLLDAAARLLVGLP